MVSGRTVNNASVGSCRTRILYTQAHINIYNYIYISCPEEMKLSSGCSRTTHIRNTAGTISRNGAERIGAGV